jgi:two-component system, oxyanion-binding sensor
MWDAAGLAYKGGEPPELNRVRLGLVPLTDCAPLVLARELGLFRRYGLDVVLSREPSWANIRDKVIYGALDGAHMLHALPLAIELGLGCRATPMVVPLVLNLNGNGITLSNALADAMGELKPAALKRVIDVRRAAGAPPLVFAATFPWSSHNYQLRYWLAAGGIDPDADVRIASVPPPLMAQNLAARHADGFCVGVPWNQLAADAGHGRVALFSRDIWRSHPEKVLGFTRAFAERHPHTVSALVAAALEAARWADEPANRAEVARILVRRGYVEAPEATVATGLTDADDRIVFHRGAANFPWVSHAEHALVQMRRWGQIGAEVDIAATAATVFRPDLYRPVAAALGVPSPTVDRKTDGDRATPWVLSEATQPIAMLADITVDGRRFDPADIAGHLAALPVFPAAAARAARQHLS